MRWLVCVAVLGCVPACGGSDSSRVRLDFTPLWQQGAQSVEQIDLRVYDSQGTLVDQQTLTDLQATADVIVFNPGPTTRFEVEASSAATGTRTPSYWGTRTVSLAPGDDLDLVVPVFPAGGVAGTVMVSDGTPLPAGTEVVATCTNPRSDADAPSERRLPIDAGAFSGTLIDGNYQLVVSFLDAVGAPYTGEVAVTIVASQTQSDVAIFAAP